MLKEIEHTQYALECAISDLDVTHHVLTSLLRDTKDKIAIESANVVLESITSRYNVAMEDGIFSTIYNTIKKIVTAIFSSIAAMFKKVLSFFSDVDKKIRKIEKKEPSTNKTTFLSPYWDKESADKVRDDSNLPISDVLGGEEALWLNLDTSSNFDDLMLDRNNKVFDLAMVLLDLKQVMFDTIDDMMVFMDDQEAILNKDFSSLDRDELNVDYKPSDKLTSTIDTYLSKVKDKLPLDDKYHKLSNKSGGDSDGDMIYGVSVLFGKKVLAMSANKTTLDTLSVTIDINVNEDIEPMSKVRGVSPRTYKSIVKQSDTLTGLRKEMGKAIIGLGRHLSKIEKHIKNSIATQNDLVDTMMTSLNDEDRKDVIDMISGRHKLLKEVLIDVYKNSTVLVKGSTTLNTDILHNKFNLDKVIHLYSYLGVKYD